MPAHFSCGRNPEKNDEKINIMWGNCKMRSQIMFEQLCCLFLPCAYSLQIIHSTLMNIPTDCPQIVVAVSCLISSFSQDVLAVQTATAPAAVPYCILWYQCVLTAIGNKQVICFTWFSTLLWFALFLHVAASFPLLLVSTKSFIDQKEIKYKYKEMNFCVMQNPLVDFIPICSGFCIYFFSPAF